MYLQPDCVLGRIKASVGDQVITPYGEGVVLKFKEEEKTFVVELGWGVMFCGEESIDKIVIYDMFETTSHVSPIDTFCLAPS